MSTRWMTNFDIKNYLEKIYKIPVVYVHSKVVCGQIRKAKSKLDYLVKDDDYREAVVDLPKHVEFKYPQIYDETKSSLEEGITKVDKQMTFLKNRERRKQYQNNRHNVPDWFGL
ncbi:39S ribosomal protein L23 [Sarcoptes scabiei]|nr:39S ribosomal protein L23 [Sarcoptes scabiei]